MTILADRTLTFYYEVRISQSKLPLIKSIYEQGIC